ncbi:G-protein-signaling modulator 3-like [Pseudonaja textilis]|uniref:G-protein-signaling modulator 3-like n=1 Tax=Pseudonaja textilis TaxID=8673 RepID=UPI000EA8966D|nr:G-protein-signaling modulator 3-like [Pseudonaja textilis]XP_026577015.1 G-protein-signaling modulator 3-like [Pseudonaja textilis]
MDHEMNAMGKEQTPKSDVSEAGTAETAGTAGKRSLTSQVEFSALPSQSPVLRSKQRTPKHAFVRPWKSLPPTPSGLLEKNQKVFFSSLTSLQAEEFFDMVATIQARRLNDQRADFVGPESASEENPGISEDQLYDTILAHQSQRLEDQRTEPPIPVGIQGLLDLLLSAQGTRMEDQRSALPPGLAAPPLLGRQPSFLHGV